MASADLHLAHKKDWPFSHPWLWLGAGAGLVLWSLLWTLSFGEASSDGRVIVLALGLLATGAGLWLRWNDPDTRYLAASRPLANSARLFMAGVFLLVALAVTGVCVLHWVQFNRNDSKPGAMTLVWLSIAPVSFAAAMRSFKREPKQGVLEATDERGLAFVVAGLLAFAGSWTLYLGAAHASDWDTMRRFLRVMTALSLLGGALVVVAPGLRRLVLSLLVVLHFGAISTACLVAPPSAYMIQQIWTRLSRPYLEFLYLLNAYHFYAPEPGPASYVWFRLIHTTPEGKDFGWWYKIPDLDDKGQSRHPIGLEYQRHLSLTEPVGATEPPPPMELANGLPNPVYFRRFGVVPQQKNDDKKALLEKILGGGPDVRGYPRIPLVRGVPPQQQLMVPNDDAEALFASYARHLGHKYAVHPEHPDWKFKSVKIYRVTHMIMGAQQLVAGLSPTDPEFYRPVYVGNFLADGTETDLDDPYRHWMLPIMRDSMNEPLSGIKDYARFHAGDPEWYRRPGEKTWSELKMEPDGFPDAKSMQP